MQSIIITVVTLMVKTERPYLGGEGDRGLALAERNRCTRTEHFLSAAASQDASRREGVGLKPVDGDRERERV
uniref:Uncharacterized protein n=1 Tax=Anguilla anguilla TaxID=7936 RepID=A0A0E9TUG1_ANGAN